MTQYYYVTTFNWIYYNKKKKKKKKRKIKVAYKLAVSPTFSGAKKAISEWFNEHPNITGRLSDDKINALEEPDDEFKYIIMNCYDELLSRKLNSILIERVPVVE